MIFSTLRYNYPLLKGAIQVLRNAFFLEIGPHPVAPTHPLVTLITLNLYTFVTLFSGKVDTPHPHLRYVTLERLVKASSLDNSDFVIIVHVSAP